MNNIVITTFITMNKLADSSRTFLSEIVFFPFICSEEYADCQYSVVPTEGSMQTVQQIYPPLLDDINTNVNTVRKTNYILVLLQK